MLTPVLSAIQIEAGSPTSLRRFSRRLRLPGDLPADQLLPLACQEGVAFAPGGSFFPDSLDGRYFMRLNFAAQPPETIEEGIKRLGKAVGRLMQP